MLFRKKTEQSIAQTIEDRPENRTYWANVRRQFAKNRLAVWALRCFGIILAIALLADFIANEKPLVCKLDGQIMFPVAHDYAVSMGMASWNEKFVTKQWSEHQYDFAIFPPIPYSSTTIDKFNRNFVSPFAEQRNLKTMQWWHWMGTDELGRDVTAGMVHGTRIAVSVGVIAMSIAAFIGILLGALAGYFGDNRLQISRIRLLLNLLGLITGIFYGFTARGYALSQAAQEGRVMGQLLLGFLIIIGCLVIANIITIPLKKIAPLGKKVTIAADILVMRFIEIINSIPGLLLILSIVAITKPSVLNIMVIIGLISWTGIARFIRAELLRVRNLEFIEAAQAMGFSEMRILFRHAIPNALTPVLIAIAFGVASAILTEAFLSFLGIGVSAEEVTWGALLNLARSKFQAWWLAIFPGFAIFITVTVFNLIGEGLTDALDPRLKTN
jgi:peptide/nickel transport system permease protein